MEEHEVQEGEKVFVKEISEIILIKKLSKKFFKRLTGVERIESKIVGVNWRKECIKYILSKILISKIKQHSF